MRRRPLHLSHEQMLHAERCRRFEHRLTVATIVAGGFMVAMMIVRLAIAHMEGKI